MNNWGIPSSWLWITSTVWQSSLMAHGCTWGAADSLTWAGARGILVPRSRSDTLGEAKTLWCLELPKISDPRGRRRPVKAASKGSGRRPTSHGQGGITRSVRKIYLVQMPPTAPSPGLEGTVWQVPQRPTDTVCVSPTVLPSLLKQAGVSQSKNPPAAWKIKTKFTLLIKNKHKRHLVTLALSCI